MKNVTIEARTTIRKTILNLGIASLFFFSILPSPVRAQVKDKPDTVDIRYIGTQDEQPLFQINFDNADGETFKVSIADETGEVLYSEKFNGKNFSRKFKLEGVELRQARLTLTIAGKQKQTQVFVINSNLRTVQDYVITRL